MIAMHSVFNVHLLWVRAEQVRLATSIFTLCNLYFIIVCNLFNIIIAQYEYLAALKQVSELLTRIYVHVTRYKCSVLNQQFRTIRNTDIQLWSRCRVTAEFANTAVSCAMSHRLNLIYLFICTLRYSYKKLNSLN